MHTRAALSLALVLAAVPPHSRPGVRDTTVRFVSDEADAALAILQSRAARRTPTLSQWNRFFSSEGYRALARRDSSFDRPFSRDVYRAFLLSDTLLARTDALARTLAAWKRIVIGRPAALALAYLPAGTALHATLFLEIKPQGNSFVFAVDGTPSIFLYVNPQETAAQLENTMAHELHHIGVGSACGAAAESSQPANVQQTREWMSAFGEGLAMLAAAGGADVHPHALDDSATKARWDKDVANFNADLATVQAFFFDVLDQRLPADSISARGMSFFGIQGPWYTVGWKMAVKIEKTFGRERLIAEMCSPQKLLATYNEAIRATHETGSSSVWSDSLLQRVGAIPSR